MYIPDDELYSIGAVGVLEPLEEPDTSSDTCDWVRQYTDWEYPLEPALPRSLTNSR